MTTDKRDAAVLIPANWLVESLRATFFPVAGVTVVPDTWWQEATGTDPETRTVKPATREQAEEGEFEGARLRLGINPLGVIQWQLTATAPTEVPVDLPNAGPLPTLLPRFLDLVNGWLPLCPAASRVAFGGTVLYPAAGHREGYSKLAEYLRNYVKVDPGSSDLLYRINRQRRSRTSIPELHINRLSTWTVLRMSIVATAAAAGRIVNDLYACRLELDVNTAPTFQGIFTPPMIAEVFDELHHLALEIVAEGDVP